MLVSAWLCAIPLLAVGPQREPCRTLSNDCGPGRACVDPLGKGSGACFTSCRAGGKDQSGCRPGEACVPFGGGPDRTYGDGVCRGDDCVPGDERRTCGGPATCVLTPPASTCGPPGGAGPGDACLGDPDVGERNCRAGLVCAEGRCATACGPTAGCPPGVECVDLSHVTGGRPFRYCDTSCDVLKQAGCPPGEACVATGDRADGRLLGRCERRPGAVRRPGEACQRDFSSYHADCIPSALCGRDGRETRCRPLCTTRGPAECPSHAVCTDQDVRYGLTHPSCAGECDPVSGAGCETGWTCVGGWRGRNASGETASSGKCVRAGGPP